MKTTNEIPVLDFASFAERYCERQEQTIDGLRQILSVQKRRYNPEGWFMLECQMMGSSRLGDLTILPFGPDNTFKTIPEHPVSPRGLASDMSTVCAVLKSEEINA